MKGLLTRVGKGLKRNSRMRIVAEVTGAILLLSGGAALGSVATSAAASNSNVIHGCENARTGALSISLRSSGRCPRGTSPVFWNRTGRAGTFGAKTNTAAVGTASTGTCVVGEAVLMPGNTLDDQMVPADGQLLSISSNEALFSLYHTEYGGNGTSTFGIPNLRSAAPNGLTYAICVTGIFP
jgi:hypothetical protein